MWHRDSTVTEKYCGHKVQDGENLCFYRVVEFFHKSWPSLLLSKAPSLSLVLSAVVSLCVFHPFSRQSDRVCPTGQPFSTHHAHHFLSSFPPVCFFHLLWPVTSLSNAPHISLYLCVFVPRCVVNRNIIVSCLACVFVCVGCKTLHTVHCNIILKQPPG